MLAYVVKYSIVQLINQLLNQDSHWPKVDGDRVFLILRIISLDSPSTFQSLHPMPEWTYLLHRGLQLKHSFLHSFQPLVGHEKPW